MQEPVILIPTESTENQKEDILKYSEHWIRPAINTNKNNRKLCSNI